MKYSIPNKSAIMDRWEENNIEKHKQEIGFVRNIIGKELVNFNFSENTNKLTFKFKHYEVSDYTLNKIQKEIKNNGWYSKRGDFEIFNKILYVSNEEL